MGMGSARLIILLGFVFTITTQIQGHPTTEFVFRGFRGNESEIVMRGDARINPSGVLGITHDKLDTTGTSFYRKSVRLLEADKNSKNSIVRSFSTAFVFVIITPSSSIGGCGFTFTLSPTPNRTGAESGHYLGLLNKSTDGDPSNHVFALEFDTAQGFKDGNDRGGNHIGLNFNNLTSEIQETVMYYDNDYPDRKEDFVLQSGDPIRVHLDYDGPTKMLNLTVYPTYLKSRPIRPLISLPVPKLSSIVQEEMYVGFTAATGNNKASAHYVMGWSFASGGEHPVASTLRLSDLPLPPPPNKEKKRGYDSKTIALIVALSVVAVILAASLLIFFVMYMIKRRQQREVLEDWEINHPHRLRYKDLYSATDGFKGDRIIGAGGFGTVFRGSLSDSLSDQIAVKKITPNSMQGIREFVAEIESLGRLSHRNLVTLRGWCKHREELLVIYDYIPHGSLDSLLYNVPRRGGDVLSWDVRFHIAKGIASGLLYLHDDGEQIVVHRDVKSSNVLIDEGMNPKLGDFGLARLYERGSQSHTTVAVGTTGYMAPEITRGGVYSPASDVFAFGVLLLEIISGKKPTGSGGFYLPDWISELYFRGEYLRAIDPSLQFNYVDGEARVALTVGVLCCRETPLTRPTMKLVMRYLNGEQDVPEINDN